MQGEQALSALQMSFAEEERPEDAITAPIAYIGTEEELSRYDDIEGRLRSRYCGLVEVHEKRIYLGNESTSKLPCISFLHKPVYEFLQNSEIWKELLSCSTDSKFSPNLALPGASLYELKVGPHYHMGGSEFQSTLTNSKVQEEI